MITKQVYYIVKYKCANCCIAWANSSSQEKTFTDRRRAEKFFDSLSDEFDKMLILHEESLLNAVYA